MERAFAIIMGWTCLLGSAGDLKPEGSERSFERRISRRVGEKDVALRLTGVALREKYWVNVYAVGSYLEAEADPQTPEALAQLDAPKALQLIMERDVDGAAMAEAFREAILAAHRAEEFPKELAAFEGFFKKHPVKKDDVIWLVHRPGKGISCQIAAHEPLALDHLGFARAVWGIYLGPKNIGEAIKKGLTRYLRKDAK